MDRRPSAEVWNEIPCSPELRIEFVIITCFLQAIEKVKTDKNDKPYTDVKILNVTVTKS
jgi:hypothetical protein